MPQLVVATFNIHAGTDGWGTPFDVVASCDELDADILVLQETWTPESGEGLASQVASSLGYESHEVPLADALFLKSLAGPGKRWGPRNPRRDRCLWVGDADELARLPRTRWEQGRRGTWGIAVLSRLPVKGVEAIELGRLSRDPARRRAAVLAEVAVDSASLTVVGTHLAHFTHGSPILLERLRSRLPTAGQPGVLAGDMNFWGPPLSLGLPGWRRAVRARTYPSWRAHSQIDHIFVTRAVRVISGAPVAAGRSDHLALRARLAID
ncbi:MAG: endonuclease/exonuclease/phosphatase family protein [Acidimicrobiales bacterium]|jgi:endonuclease/exonuclease/phosphatase family metal-dependent hydrolase